MHTVKKFLLVNFLLFSSMHALAINNTSSMKAIAETATQVTPLLNGQYVPNVEVTTLSGDIQPLQKVLNNKKTILFFYRGGWCPFCNTQMGQLKQIEPQLQALGFQLIGISTDNVQDLQKSIGKHELNYQLLADFNSVTSQAFGLAYFTSQKVTDRYLSAMQLKNPLQTNAAEAKRLVLPVPAIYVIDDQGLVQFNYVNINYQIRLHEELLLKAAQLVK